MYLVDMCFTEPDKLTAELTAQHRQYLAKEYESNRLLFGGRKVPRTGGIIISRHDTEKALRQMLDADPFIQSGAVSYTITEFVPVMAAGEYNNLIA
ncbi:YciI family protein [Shewanella sedimentimangrovi]|uniref:YCII-related domain-containing protein n=1 Tax=Shewanella sedimentimangrovi TaxID=2814293 RepID=A0ABX7QZK6_9GAMM|nr:YciI family protein [Shewanella sedimentimangrovi]QSX36977.1 hypothetical protein JYB85_17215 [Shewanella sedimentimangrovi]